MPLPTFTMRIDVGKNPQDSPTMNGSRRKRVDVEQGVILPNGRRATSNLSRTKTRPTDLGFAFVGITNLAQQLLGELRKTAQHFSHRLQLVFACRKFIRNSADAARLPQIADVL